MSKKIVDPRFARKGEYKEVIDKIIEEGKCPFCPENFIYHKKPKLKSVGDWFITESSWPYPKSQQHFLLICQTHKETFSEITAEDMVQVIELVNWAVTEFKIPGAGLCLRFGETEYTGATVCHLHFQLIVPIKSQTVNFPVG